jgi:hypothetical protein
VASFDNLPKGASHTDIYAQAGKIFEEQVRRDRQTDYTQNEAFNDAIWYIAKEAQCRGFTNLEDMSLRTIAKEMGGYIYWYLKTNDRRHFWQRW